MRALALILAVAPVPLACTATKQSSTATADRSDRKPLTAEEFQRALAASGVRMRDYKPLSGDAPIRNEQLVLGPTTQPAAAVEPPSTRPAAPATIPEFEKIVLENIANTETPGYKAARIIHRDSDHPQVVYDMSPGVIEKTDSPLDLAIDGPGFLRAHTDGKPLYTRLGKFLVDADGQLMIAIGEGYPLEPAITLPQGITDLKISPEGFVTAVLADGIKSIGRVELFVFENPEQLQRVGPSLYSSTDGSGKPTRTAPGENGAGKLVQRSVESSNVDVMRERVWLKYLRTRPATRPK